MSPLDKETKLQIEASADKMSTIFLPYDLADQIIDEVMKNGKKSRDAVMQMILKHNAQVIKSSDRGRSEIVSALKNSNKQS